MRQKILNILFWSIISAAFIGPGTITTAAKAGASYGYSLLWALVFSTFACLVLQEAAARLTIVSTKSLGRAIAETYGVRKGGWMVFVFVLGAIIIGSAAYETGNLLGAAEGIRVVDPVNVKMWVLFIGVIAFFALLFPGMRLLARILGFLVVLMGVVFLVTAFLLKPDIGGIFQGAVVPSFPAGSSLLILGLVGTTVVPYNLFLGSGIADKTQAVSEMRFGISVAVILGGAISMAVLIVGTSVTGGFSFVAVGEALASKLGGWAVWFFGFGLFAAGFSSAVTAPLASALTAGDLFKNRNKVKWAEKGLYFKLTWGFVLLAGLFFGTIGLKPVPAIIAAQALNGFILPFISIFLWFAVNNRSLMGESHLNSMTGNLLFGFVVWITLLLGTHNLFLAMTGITGITRVETGSYYIVLMVFTFLIMMFFYYRIMRSRKQITEQSDGK